MAIDTYTPTEIAKNVASARYLGKANGANVVGVGIGTKTVAGVDTLIPCIKFYVSRKPTPDDIPPANLIPDTFLDVPTDVVDIGRAFGPRINARRISPDSNRPARPGDSIGLNVRDSMRINVDFSGTLGAVLQRADDPKQRFILGNNHVLALNGRVPPGTEIVTPGAEDGLGMMQKTIATLTARVHLTKNQGNGNYADCAIASVREGAEVTSVFPDNVIVREVGEPSVGLPVFKYGKSTARTSGKIVDVSADILVDYAFGTFKFVDQILIDGGENGFAMDGDSGALLIANVPASPSTASHKDAMTNGNAPNSAEAVGLVFAPVGRFAAACPISKVLDLLENEIQHRLVFASDAGAPTRPH
jgi:hypothetical protein